MRDIGALVVLAFLLLFFVLVFRSRFEEDIFWTKQGQGSMKVGAGCIFPLIARHVLVQLSRQGEHDIERASKDSFIAIQRGAGEKPLEELCEPVSIQERF